MNPYVIDLSDITLTVCFQDWKAFLDLERVPLQ